MAPKLGERFHRGAHGLLGKAASTVQAGGKPNRIATLFMMRIESLCD
jgi:hypothetical protein